ncbi:MAG: GAF domain-containing protein, partial [Ktedonobacterales bacterium]
MQNWVQRRTSDRDLERRTRQIKEIVRIGMSLRADMDLESVLAQIVEAITSTLGFGAAVLNLAHEENTHFEVVATAGVGEAERQRLVQSPPLVARLLAVMRPEFCISHSYFISHHYKHVLDGVEGVTLPSSLPPSAQRAPDAWHPEDVLFVPLISPGGDRLLGILSLDQPEDGKVPSLESIEMLELFASQAA